MIKRWKEGKNVFRGRRIEVEEEENRNKINVEKHLLYGMDIHSGRIPGDLSSDKCKVFFSAERGRGFGLSDDILSKHLLLLGGIGSGKTNTINFIMDSLQKSMTDEDIMIIFDSKGDYKERFFDVNNSKHILIAHAKEYRGISKSWNIFDELKNSHGEYEENVSISIAKEISKQLFSGRESASQPFFVRAAADIVSKVLIHKIREWNKSSKLHELTTADFVSFIHGATVVDYHKMLYQYKDFKNATTYLGVTKDGGMIGGQGLGVIAEINSMVNDMFSGPFAEDYGNGSISMRELVRRKQGKTVFVEYDLSVGITLAPIYRILFDLALKEALGGRTEKRGNVYFIIDEASLLPNLIHLQDALNFGRSLGVKVIAGLQSITQLYDAYGEEKGKVIAAGFMNSFCFQTWDLESRQFISERFGANYQNLSYYYDGKPIILQRDGNVVEDWDILNLEVGEALINLTQQKVIRFKYKFKEFK